MLRCFLRGYALTGAQVNVDGKSNGFKGVEVLCKIKDQEVKSLVI